MAKQPAKNSSKGLTGWKKQALIHAGIIFSFFIIVALYFRPIVFEGQVVDQHDIVQFKGMAQETVEFRERTGEEALWVSTLFSGMPAFQTNVIFTGDLFSKINKLLWFGIPRPANYVFLTFLGFYLLLNTMKFNPWQSAVGAIAFALSSYFFVILAAGHTSKANAIAYMAPIIAGVLMTFRGKLLLGSAVTAFFLALEIATNHYQITYYLAIMLLILGIAFGIDAIKNKTLPEFLKASAALIIVAIMAVGPNAGRLMTTYEYGDETMRGKAELESETADKKSGLPIDYAFGWSYGISESFTLLIPNFHGGASATLVKDRELERKFGQKNIRLPTYWGDQPSTSGPVYAGAIVCFLFILGLIIVPGKMKWWLLTATVLGLMLSWGRHFMAFNEVFFYYFPLYNKFRAVSMALVIAEFTMPLLGMLALRQVFLDKEAGKDMQPILKAIYVAAGITGGFALLMALVGPQIMSFEGAGDARYANIIDILRDFRISMFQKDAFRSFGFILAGAGLLWLTIKDYVKNPIILWVGLAGLMLVDMLPVNARYLNDSSYVSPRKYAQQFNPTQADQFILQDKDPNYRVLNLSTATFDDAMTSYHHKSIGGYHAAKLRRYDDLKIRHLQPEIQQFASALQGLQQVQEQQPQLIDSILRSEMAKLDVINMLNGRYIILNPQQRPLQNLSAYGNAWFVQKIEKVNSPDEEITKLRSINPRNVAVVDQTIFDGYYSKQLDGLTLSADPSARIALTSFEPNHLTYEATTSKEQVAIFSEVYYNHGKGWKAYIDGTPTEHFRANYILRGLRIPAGKHTIEFKFEPSTYYQGNTLSMIFSILLLLLVAGALFLEYRSKQNEVNSPIENVD